MRLQIGAMITLVLSLTHPEAMARSSDEAPTKRLPPQGLQLNLRPPFHTRSDWRLVVTEGHPVVDFGGNEAPGALSLYLRKTSAGACVSGPVTPSSAPAAAGYPGLEPHYLLRAEVVQPAGSKVAPLLLIVTGSLYSGDGDQAIATQLLGYDPGKDAFRRVFANRTGHNNDQETRVILKGPLRGSVIIAEPQNHSPFGFWIVVERPASSGSYRPVLRYGSATRYGDGNPLAVIDSEMPTIEKRLGVLKPGQPIPVPEADGDAKPCPRPAMRHGELWCG